MMSLVFVYQDWAFVASEKYKEHKSVIEIAFIKRVTRERSSSSSSENSPRNSDEWFFKPRQANAQVYQRRLGPLAWPAR